MAQQYFYGFLMLLLCLFLEVSSRPSNNEEATLKLDLITENIQPFIEDKAERLLPYDETVEVDENTKDILDKIKAINDALKKPNRRQQINWNPPHTGGEYVLDKEILQKLQEIIATGKLNQQQSQNVNHLRYSRNLHLLQQNPQPTIPMPYLTSMPVLVMPSITDMYGYQANNMLSRLVSNPFQTREESTSPFQFQWLGASLFPILIRDPLLSIMNGGGWSHFIQTGQSADICRRQNSNNELDDNVRIKQSNAVDNTELNSDNTPHSRRARAVSKRTIPENNMRQSLENTEKPKLIFSKPTATKKPIKQKFEELQDTKTNGEPGDLRFPFGDWSMFGSRQPVIPGPGFYINTLRVRKGGVAIAGPGGVATAGRGGTAIVGPGGLAYTQPGGIAVAGPAARVIALSQETDLNDVASRLRIQANINDTSKESQPSPMKVEHTQSLDHQTIISTTV